VTALRGDVTALRGDVTALRGDVTALRGDVTALRGGGRRGDVRPRRPLESRFRRAALSPLLIASRR